MNNFHYKLYAEQILRPRTVGFAAMLAPDSHPLLQLVSCPAQCAQNWRRTSACCCRGLFPQRNRADGMREIASLSGGT